VFLKIKVGPGLTVKRNGVTTLTELANMTALTGSSQSAYYYDNGTGTLHLKLTGPADEWEELDVTRN
jgi:hypothetical protein